MTHVKKTKPVVRRPIVGAHCNGLLECLFGVIQPIVLLVHVREASVRGVVRRLQIEPPAVFVKCLVVAACAAKYQAETEGSGRKSGVTFRAPLAILYGCVPPLVVMRRSGFTPVGFSKSRIRSGKGRILLECGGENFDGVLYVF